MKHRESGFTLIEITIAIAITSTVLLTIYGVFGSVSAAKERVERESAGYHQARVLFDRMGREIRGAYLKTANASTLFKGEKNDSGLPVLTLSTTASTPQGGTGGIVIVRYELRPDPDTAEHDKALFRSEYPLFFPEEARNASYKLASGIEEMRLRYFSEGAWREDWQQGLPQMVELSLTIRIGEKTVPFISAFEIPATGGK